jgi:hypothetical protein
MSETGAIFAARGADGAILDSDDDNFDPKSKEKRACLLFRIFNTKPNVADEWRVTLTDNPVAVAVGDIWCCVFTENLSLRLFTTFGGV